MLSIGPPIGRARRRGPGWTAKYVVNVVFSVGPYTLKILVVGHAAATRPTACGDVTFPPVQTSRTFSKQPGSPSASALNRPVVRKRPEILPAAPNLLISTALTSSGDTTTRPPVSSGVHTS